MNVEELTEKARQFCAYRERCTAEVHDKLRRLGAGRESMVQVTKNLREEGFLDDKRFATLFVRSKFQQNKWGKVKIKAALLAKNIPEDYIPAALDVIDDQSYEDTLHQLATKKKQELQGKSSDEVTAKTASHCIRKGYEPALVWHRLKIMNNKKE